MGKLQELHLQMIWYMYVCVCVHMCIHIYFFFSPVLFVHSEFQLHRFHSLILSNWFYGSVPFHLYLCVCVCGGGGDGGGCFSLIGLPSRSLSLSLVISIKVYVHLTSLLFQRLYFSHLSYILHLLSPYVDILRIPIFP